MIIGNESKQKFLSESLMKIESGCFLLFGPEGVGKFSFIKEFLSEKLDEEKIFLTSEEKNYYIDSARLLTSLAFQKSQRRFIVIDNIDNFKIEAQNTLLKTLEYSLSKTVFVMITSRFYKILPTIRSRSILVKFNLVSSEDIFNFLKNKGYKINLISEALKFYPYQPGKVLKFLENIDKFKLLKKFIDASFDKKLLLIDNLKESLTLKEILEFYLINERLNLRKNKKNSLTNVKNILSLYFDSDYNLNFEIQLSNLIFNYG